MGPSAAPPCSSSTSPRWGPAPTTLAPVFDAIRALHPDGTAVLLVEQNGKKALEAADRGLVMELGALRYDAPAADLLAGPGSARRT